MNEETRRFFNRIILVVDAKYVIILRRLSLHMTHRCLDNDDDRIHAILIKFLFSINNELEYSESTPTYSSLSSRIYQLLLRLIIII